MKTTKFHINHALINYSTAIVFNNIAYASLRTLDNNVINVKFNLN